MQLHGRVDQPQLAGLMAAAHIFVLLSLYEGLPLVLLEALACGCRIVTTGLPGCQELLDDIDCELVSYVELPALATIDRLTPHVEEPFAGKLAAALVTMAERVRRTPKPGSTAIFAGLTAQHTWAAVFARVEAAYRLATAARTVKPCR